MPERPVDCPACRQASDEPFYEQADAPILSNILCRTEQEATNVPVGDIELRLCHSCGLIFNARFDPSRVLYEAEYENALHFSAVFREHEDRLLDRLINEYHVANADVVEIGCGDGHFLSALCERGGNRGTGFDPAFDFERHQRDLHESVSIHPREFTAASLAEINPSGICCRHVLEHLPQPAHFLRALHEGLNRQREAVIYFEVPSAMHSLARRGFWDVIYEHHSYFTVPSLRILFERCGFEVLEVSETYSDQFIGLFARPQNDFADAVLDHGTRNEMVELTRRFGADYRAEIDKWSDLLDSDRDQRVVAWGAGSKGITFLNALGDAGKRIEAIVDLNPRKHGCYVVGAAQPIVPPSDLIELRPDRVIVMNATYQSEIAAQLDQMGCRAEVLALS